MFQRVRKHLSYANVTATLALVLAVAGGGLALATIQGDGAATFRGQKGLPESGFDKIAKVRGVGKVLGQCDNLANTNTIRFKNTSGRTLLVTSFNQDSGTSDGPSFVADGDTSDIEVGGATIRYHIFRFGGDGTPMADVTVTSVVEGSCEGGVGLFVEALSTR